MPSLTAPKPDTIYSREIGEKRYELTDHLNNMGTTLISDFDFSGKSFFLECYKKESC